jgi:hypothetical protein
MVARSADNGSCEAVSKGSREAREARRRRSQAGEAEGRHLRKTARGASSPAKPALHIPELSIVSSSPSCRCASRAAVEDEGRLRDVGGAAVRISPSTIGMAGARIWRCTHPLSITRAATSSAAGDGR